MIIKNYDDFVNVLLDAGFSMGGGNDEGIFAVVPFSWNEDAPYETPVKWHTGDKDTDPWEWRMRVLDERDDIAYAKLFFRKSGYITKQWYPYFLAARRGRNSLQDEYKDGKISQYAKRIYDVISENGSLPLHILKQLCGFSKEDNSRFERGLVELQMKLYLTMCGHSQKISRIGQEYGWSSTVFCTTENFFGQDVFEQAAKITEQVAFGKITAQIYSLNPTADEKKIKKFIKG